MSPGYPPLVVATDQTGGSRGSEALQAPERERSPSGDIFVLGEPADPLLDIDWTATLRGVTREFFADRDTDRPLGQTVAKLAGVIVALTAVALVVLAAFVLGTIVLLRPALG
jgi:hypothetical protein